MYQNVFETLRQGKTDIRYKYREVHIQRSTETREREAKVHRDKGIERNRYIQSLVFRNRGT